MKARAAILILAFALAAGAAYAWETDVEGCESWTCVYKNPNTKPNAQTLQGFNNNEHTEITDIALQRMGVDRIFGIGGEHAKLMIVDLNASFFRPELKGKGGAFVSTLGGGPLETRELAAVPFYSGVPDFTYSVDDWINKAEFCPPRPSWNPLNPLCHNYKAWLGAGFNSSHFGNQAKLSYERLHEIALNLARNARNLREKVTAANNEAEGTLDAYRDYIREAELEALIMESAAAHFLEDRWSMGHMWQRWNGPDYWQSATPNNLVHAAEVAAASGLMHGSEAVTGWPDPMSAPTINAKGNAASVPPVPPTLELSQYRIGQGEKVAAVGDDRLYDALRGLFGAKYSQAGNVDGPINVTTQMNMMFDCLGGSYYAVIGSFGQNGAGFGIDEAPARNPYAGRNLSDCTAPLATNHTLYLAWVRDPLTAAGGAARITYNVGSTWASYGVAGINPLRGGWVATTAQLSWNNLFDPDNTDLAAGGLTDFGDVPSGDRYGVPRYFPPADLNALPERQDMGVDKQAYFGFFNRSHADYFCTGLAARLKPLRGSKDEVQREVCRYLADRAYAGTDESYHGKQAERREFGGKPALPICAVFDGPARIRLDSYDPETPYWLHPGYVPVRLKGQGSAPVMAERNVSTKSIAGWCDKIPVLDYVDDPELRDGDIVAEAEGAGDEITVHGFDLGAEPGTVTLTTPGGGALAAPTINTWWDEGIVLQLAEDMDPGADTLLVAVKRADGVESVGRFVVTVKVERPGIESVRLYRGGETFYERAAPNAPPAKFRPLSPGEAELEVVFDRDMKTDYSGAPQQPLFAVGPWVFEGAFADARTWRGKAQIPSGAEFNANRGVRPVLVLAASEEGVFIDSDPNADGPQPDQTHKIVVDEIPPFLKRIEVATLDGTVYEAAWSEGEAWDEDENLLFPAHRRWRKLFVSDAADVPVEGKARIEIELSREVSVAPVLAVGGIAVALSGSGADWNGEFDLEAVQAGSPGDYVQIVLKSGEGAAIGFDADPRTAVALDPGEENNWWQFLDAEPGRLGPNGGEDRWHKLGPAPDLSLVIVLDASGSMGEDTGRIEAARAGIAQTLDALPDNVEVGAVIFYDCGSIQTHPFSRKPEKIRDALLAAQPSGSTPLAASLEVARTLLETGAHPASRAWRYAPFTDGEETCNGDVQAAFAALEAAAQAHARTVLPALGDPSDLAPPPAEEEEKPQIACRPASRKAYWVDVRDGGLHLDDIALVEIAFTESQGENGCVAELIEQTFRVDYTTARNPSEAMAWKIQARPRRRDVRRATEFEGEDALEAIRLAAESRLADAYDLARARSEIDGVVRRNMTR